MNSLVLLTSAGQIPININGLLQNMYGQIMIESNGGHINLRQMIETEFTKEDLREMLGEEE